MEAGVTFPELNVGNMSQSDETRSVTRSINVVDKDIADFDAIKAKGVKLVAQMVPGDSPQDFMTLLNKVR
ncbi:Fructose-specific phosphotransferase enzyme IIB component [Chlamydia trachomatis]|nr:Fructose-specific phosphotransferase enzyme IIB component [Chlamydia trachomatis]